MIDFTIKQFNSLTKLEAIDALTRCCGATRWASGMENQRPFSNRKSLIELGIKLWSQMGEADWRQAFKHHPKIGSADSLQKRFVATRDWAEQEQQGSQSASLSVLEALALGNQTYENRFGFIFIVCATAKKAEEMLQLLELRLNNDPQAELRIAAEEQGKITKIRLERLIHE
ncbi:MAG: 2-oxo-4-hydroxy-4-carboxy-5-ureidoimidazoline decarboxylase [Bdellovibrionales bacterium]|nr:2-oxo-4-hydroxy-4-carboxy-5-ureidoimidazoline decarboxylase [Bdellovibrionales bacterium]